MSCQRLSRARIFYELPEALPGSEYEVACHGMGDLGWHVACKPHVHGISRHGMTCVQNEPPEVSLDSEYEVSRHGMGVLGWHVASKPHVHGISRHGMTCLQNESPEVSPDSESPEVSPDSEYEVACHGMGVLGWHVACKPYVMGFHAMG